MTASYKRPGRDSSEENDACSQNLMDLALSTSLIAKSEHPSPL